MATNRYVNVTITRDSISLSAEDFSTMLLLGTSASVPFKKLTSAEALSVITTDFGADSAEYDLATAILSQEPRPRNLYVAGVLMGEADTPAKLVSFLNEIVETQESFYFLVCPVHTTAVQTAIGTWTETQTKFYATTTELLDPSTIGKFLRTYTQTNKDDETYAGERVAAHMMQFEPGTADWQFKTIAGLAPAGYKSTEVTGLEAKNGNTYIRLGGVEITSNGVMLSGEYADILQASDLVQARVTEGVYAVLVRNKKVNFDQLGLNKIEAGIVASLESLPDGVIAVNAAGKRMYKVTMPTSSQVSADDKRNRILKNIQVMVTVAGAVNQVDITLNMTYTEVEVAA